MVRRPSFTISNIFSKTDWPIKAKFYVEPPFVGGTEVCFAASGSHDQDGCTAHIWKKNLQKSSPEQAPKLGM